MRVFEFQTGELVEPDGATRVLIVDLDSIVRLRGHANATGMHYHVSFSNGDGVWVTEPAFDRIQLAWKSDQHQ